VSGREEELRERLNDLHAFVEVSGTLWWWGEGGYCSPHNAERQGVVGVGASTQGVCVFGGEETLPAQA